MMSPTKAPFQWPQSVLLFSGQFRIAMRVIGLAAHRGSLFARRDSDTTPLTPYPGFTAWVFEFCFHRLSWFHLVLPAPSGIERRLQWCSRLEICRSPMCTSTQVFRPKGIELLQFPRCGPQRTKSGPGTVGSERPDTTAFRPWAMMRHSQKLTPFGLSAPCSVNVLRAIKARTSPTQTKMNRGFFLEV